MNLAEEIKSLRIVRSDRVYFIQSADDRLRRLHKPGEVTLPNIDDVELHTLTTQLTTSFFDSIREDYEPFDDWFRAKAREGRSAWVYREESGADIQMPDNRFI